MWDRHHPRRDEVMDRVHDQDHRINCERREGELTGRQAFELRGHDRAVFHQEQRDARFNGGYITKGEQQHFNHELNRNGARIGD